MQHFTFGNGRRKVAPNAKRRTRIRDTPRLSQIAHDQANTCLGRVNKYWEMSPKAGGSQNLCFVITARRRRRKISTRIFKQTTIHRSQIYARHNSVVHILPRRRYSAEHCSTEGPNPEALRCLTPTPRQPPTTTVRAESESSHLNATNARIRAQRTTPVCAVCRRF